MKKITLSLLGFICFLTTYSQTFTTGQITLSTTSGLEYSAQIDINTLVTLTLIGPSDRWLGLGLGVQSMTNNGDVVVYTGGSTLTDRTFGGIGVLPALDSSQNWTVTSNNVASGVRTLIATRALNTGEANDYVFTATTDPINLVWARGNFASFSLSNHGMGNRGITSSAVTLGINDKLAVNKFELYPNPAQNELNINFPKRINNVKADIYNTIGKLVATSTISNVNSSIDISNLNSGLYVIRLFTSKETFAPRKFMINQK